MRGFNINIPFPKQIISLFFKICEPPDGIRFWLTKHPFTLWKSLRMNFFFSINSIVACSLDMLGCYIDIFYTYVNTFIIFFILKITFICIWQFWVLPIRAGKEDKVIDEISDFRMAVIFTFCNLKNFNKFDRLLTFYRTLGLVSSCLFY